MTNIYLPAVILSLVTLVPFVEAMILLKRRNLRRTAGLYWVIVLIALIVSAVTLVGGLRFIRLFDGSTGTRWLLLLEVLLFLALFHSGLLVSLLFFEKIQKWYESHYK